MLSLAYEPEAAAICCKEATVKKREGAKGCSLDSFEPGQQFMVLDCGGILFLFNISNSFISDLYT